MESSNYLYDEYGEATYYSRYYASLYDRFSFTNKFIISCASVISLRGSIVAIKESNYDWFFPAMIATIQVLLSAWFLVKPNTTQMNHLLRARNHYKDLSLHLHGATIDLYSGSIDDDEACVVAKNEIRTTEKFVNSLDLPGIWFGTGLRRKSEDERDYQLKALKRKLGNGEDS